MTQFSIDRSNPTSPQIVYPEIVGALTMTLDEAKTEAQALLDLVAQAEQEAHEARRQETIVDTIAQDVREQLEGLSAEDRAKVLNTLAFELGML